MYKRNGTHHSYKLQNPAKTVAQLCSAICGISMTSLLMHTVAHSTRPSFRPKTNNQPLKKVFKSCGQLSKSGQKLDVILENKVV